MKTDIKITTNHILIVSGVLIGGYLVVRGAKTAKATAQKVVDKVNPASHDNFINSGVNAIGTSVTGDKHWTLGTAIYDWLHPEEFSSKKTRVDPADQAIIDQSKEGLR